MGYSEGTCSYCNFELSYVSLRWTAALVIFFVTCFYTLCGSWAIGVFLLLCRPSSWKHSATTFWNASIKNNCISRTMQWIEMWLLPLHCREPAHSNDTSIAGLICSFGVSTAKIYCLVIEGATHSTFFSYTFSIQGSYGDKYQACSTRVVLLPDSAKILPRVTSEKKQETISVIHSWLTNLSDCYVKLHLAKAGIDARALAIFLQLSDSVDSAFIFVV